jgi:hypothetical protein
MEYGIWESSKNSGLLIGLDPLTYSKVHNIYSIMQMDIGFSEKDYHESLLSGFQEFGNIDKIKDATTKLEQVFSFKNTLMEEEYDQVIKFLNEKID